MLEGPYFAGCLLLLVAGGAKAARPADTGRALVALLGRHLAISIDRACTAVRTLALVEVLVGAAGLLVPSALTASLVAASYAAFTLTAAAARRMGGPLSTCGCFGTPDTPATRTHLAITAGVALSGAVVAAETAGSASPLGAQVLWHLLAAQPWHGVPLLATSAGLAFVAWLAMTLLARLEVVR